MAEPGRRPSEQSLSALGQHRAAGHLEGHWVVLATSVRLLGSCAYVCFGLIFLCDLAPIASSTVQS